SLPSKRGGQHHRKKVVNIAGTGGQDGSEYTLLGRSSDFSVQFCHVKVQYESGVSLVLGSGKKGSLVAMIKGTDSGKVGSILRQLPESKREKVAEVTLGMAASIVSCPAWGVFWGLFWESR